jgi:hypothetical protein
VQKAKEVLLVSRCRGGEGRGQVAVKRWCRRGDAAEAGVEKVVQRRWCRGHGAEVVQVQEQVQV